MILKTARMGHPVLRQPAAPVREEDFSSGLVSRIVADLFETLADYDGVGLAAPQVHVPLRIFVVSVPPVGDPPDAAIPPTVLVNPVLTPLTETTMDTWEGCLSIPDLVGLVTRPRAIRVDFTDIDGMRRTLDAEGFPAAVLQHEADHLDGVLYIDRIRDLKNLHFRSEHVRHWRRAEEEPAGD